MSSRSESIGVLNDFSGGQNSASPNDSLQLNEAVESCNMVVMPNGKGIRTRNGDQEFNSSAMNSGANVQGLGYYKQQDQDDFLVAIAGDKIFKSDSLDGTMDDITGALTITAGQNNTWTSFVAEDSIVFVGGAPDAPIKWTGTGNGAVLGGSPQSGRFGFFHNNRAFIGSPDANRSTLYWSILGNIEDWSGDGSGSSDIQKSDGDILVGFAIISEDRVLLFKQNSIHTMVGRTSPFPVIRFKKGVGAVGKHAIVHGQDGLIYFITPKARMAITDGTRIIGEESLPRLKHIDDVWDGLNSDRLSQIRGVAYTGLDFRWIVWTGPNGASTTNDYGIYWDIDNRCWGVLPEGWGHNIFATTQDKTLYAGGFDGKIYTKDVANVTTDASNSSATVVGIWRSGWHHLGNIMRTKYIDEYRIGAKTETSGQLNVRTGVDHSPDIKTSQVSLISPGGKWGQMVWGVDKWGGRADFISPRIFVNLRGYVFQTTFDNKSGAGTSWRLNEYSPFGKVAD